MKGKKFITIISIVCILAVVLCIPAFATVTESDGDGYSLYNGVLLLTLPEWNEDVYPYAVLQGMNGSYRFIVSSSPIYITVVNGNEYVSVSSNASGRWWEFHDGGNSWAIGSYSSVSPVVSLPVFWANYDVQYEDGTLYLDSSEPISLDGYNIIEWDGDTTGLEFISAYNVYVLTDVNSDVVNAFTVMNLSYSDTPVIFDSFGRFIINGGWYVGAGSTPFLCSAGAIPLDNVFYVGALQFEDIDSSGYTSLIAYRTVEAPPDEGGGTEPDDPQPPFGAAEIYLKLHPFLLTPQLK